MRRFPDKTKDRAELQAALARYSGPVTKCPPGTANAPGVSLNELDVALQRKERMLNPPPPPHDHPPAGRLAIRRSGPTP
jgi:hypothetical protein